MATKENVPVCCLAFTDSAVEWLKKNGELHILNWLYNKIEIDTDVHFDEGFQLKATLYKPIQYYVLKKAVALQQASSLTETLPELSGIVVKQLLGEGHYSQVSILMAFIYFSIKITFTGILWRMEWHSCSIEEFKRFHSFRWFYNRDLDTLVSISFHIFFTHIIAVLVCIQILYGYLEFLLHHKERSIWL
jgi:hypothetical protein